MKKVLALVLVLAAASDLALAEDAGENDRIPRSTSERNAIEMAGGSGMET